MADAVLKSLLEDRISLNDITEWLSNDADDLKLVTENGNNTVCAKGEFVLHVLSLLRQSFLIAHPLSNSSSKSLSQLSKTGGNVIKNEGKPNPTISTVKVHSVKPQMTPNIIQDMVEPQREDRSGLSHTFSPPHAKPNQGETINSPFPALLRTPPHSPFRGDNHSITPIRGTQRSAERDPRNRHPDSVQNSPISDSRFRNNSRSLSLADFIKESPNQKKRQGVFSPKSEKIATSTPTRGSENYQDCNSSSPAWKNKKPHRRIKPTKILTFDEEKSPKSGFPTEELFGIIARAQGRSSSFETQADLDVSRASISFAEERSLLMGERLKLQNTPNQSTPPKLASMPTKSTPVKEVADPNKVTSRSHLLLLSDLYSSIIDANLTPNIMTELHFVLSLLVVQRSSPAKKQKTEPERPAKDESINFDSLCIDISKEEKDVMNSEVDKSSAAKDDCISEPSPDHLDTVHNCVFFACNLLWRQRHILANLDRATVKLLLDNERVATFMPSLASVVQEIYAKASPRIAAGQSMNASSVVFNCSASENVTFHSERDNSTNFESSNAFRSFRKQRDAFYEIFQIWEADHLNPSWNYNATLKPKIRALLDMCRDSTNYMHLARLFRMQLVAVVMGGKRLSDDLESSSSAECLRGVDPEKLSRLRERLMKPYSSEGPRPPPQFPGHQEFFRKFIKAADNVSFVEHLKDNLVSHLLELDHTAFFASDVEDSDLVVDEETRQAYINCVTTMQLLAKFLGFIVFLPYRNAADIPRDINESQLAIRSKMGVPLDVMACVVDAWTNQRLVVTLPWVVQYLGMLDEGSLELPAYRNSILFLLHVYADLARRAGSLEAKAPKTEFLLRLVLGWLFEMPCLPDGFLFRWRRAERDRLQGTSDYSLVVERSHSGILPVVNPGSSLGVTPSAPVDSLDLVDTSVLYAVCPFLLGLRGLLSTLQDANASSAGSARHITPVSTALVQPEPVSAAQLQLQLEESFFHGLPESVQTTVDFVVKRVTSACIKQICNTLVPELKERGRLEFRNAVAQEIKNGTNKAAEEKLIQRRDAVVKQVVTEMRTKCNQNVLKICSERCAAALTALLSQISVPPAVCEMCISISSRLSTERVIAWFRTHATFRKYAAELQDEMEKGLGNKGDDQEVISIVEKNVSSSSCT